MTSNRNNYLSSHSDSENIRVVNPVLSSSSDQNRIIGNINTTRRRDHSENQVNLNRITSNSNTTRNQTSNRNYNQGQFNSNLDYIGTVIAQSLQELQEDAIFDEIEERSNRNQLNRANSNSNNYTTTTMSNNFNTNTLSGNMIQPIRYAPAYEYLPRLHSLSEVIPINSQTGRFYLGRDRNMNILRGRIVLGDDGGITISLSDMVGGGESVQTFPSKIWKIY